MTHVEWTIDVTMMEANKKKTEEKKRETIVLIFWAIIKNEWMNATENDGEATKNSFEFIDGQFEWSHK